ncbi:hypothetical protein F4779DRAFT_591821 [Xylariaceae sp. FL0662B]|nr:hypothetical protein F4779DRAFT_591821 [Xylariaceae sp. FL0662B]
MGFDVLSKLTKKWENLKPHKGDNDEEDTEVAQLREERNRFLGLIAAKLTGPSAVEMQPLTYDLDTPNRAVLLVTVPIEFGKFELSKRTYKLLARHVGMSLNSVSHWALCVIDRGFGICYCYDLMSDDMALTAIGKNYFRVAEITPGYIETWSSCYYVGETTKSHEEVQELGVRFMTLHPRYKLLSNNCQDLVENLVKEVCDGKVISQAKLSEELSLASPKIALDLMVARFRSKREGSGDTEDSKTVKEELEIIKELWDKVRR